MKRKIASTIAPLALIIPAIAPAIMARPAAVVGPPEMMVNGLCRVSVGQTGGTGAGPAIPFPALALGAPVERTTTSFTTGGGGTSNAALAAQRKAAGLPYAPPIVKPASGALPATFAVDRNGPGPIGWAPYQQLRLAPSTRVAEPFGLIFATAASPTRGRIVALTLSIAGRPTAPPRVRLTVDGPPVQGCRPQVIQIYAPSMSASALATLSAPGGKGCRWFNLDQCPRAQWPRGRILFVSPLRDNAFEYRWIDYGLLADWHFATGKR